MTETTEKKELKRIEYEKKRLEYIRGLGYGSIDGIIDEARKALDEEPEERDWPQWDSMWSDDAYIDIDDGKYRAFCGEGEPLVTDSLERAVDWIVCLSAWDELEKWIEHNAGSLDVSVDYDGDGWPALFLDGSPATHKEIRDRLDEEED